MTRADLTRDPLPPPFSVGTRVKYLGNAHISMSLDGRPGTLVKHHGMVVEIARVVNGRRGTGRQLRDEDGPMFYDDDNHEPILDETKDGYSVYVVVDARGREHGRVIHRESMSEWEVVS